MPVSPLRFFGEDALEQFAAWLSDQPTSGIWVLCDENTRRFCLPALEGVLSKPFQCISVAAGEASKTLDTASQLWDQWLQEGADRSAWLLNLGGGMVTDLGGFAASVYKRGIPFVHLSTTLLGMVDAAYGGKTGINFGGFKNSLGSFSQPEAIVGWPGFLQTLSPRALRAGWAEMAKHGAVADAAHWAEIAQTEPGQLPERIDLIEASVAIKAQVVEADPTEKNRRKLLNFGHTVGHAFESWSARHEDDPLWHGEAVAFGMAVESFLANQRGLLSWRDGRWLRSVIERRFGRYRFPPDAFPSLLALMRNDKKNQRGALRCVLLSGLGSAWPSVAITEEWMAEALRAYQKGEE
jgi:3-dehydroquinate synthase